MINVWLYGLLIVGFVGGWVARMVFAATNQYRMLKRLTAYQKQQSKGALMK